MNITPSLPLVFDAARRIATSLGHKWPELVDDQVGQAEFVSLAAMRYLIERLSCKANEDPESGAQNWEVVNEALLRWVKPQVGCHVPAHEITLQIQTNGDVVITWVTCSVVGHTICVVRYRMSDRHFLRERHGPLSQDEGSVGRSQLPPEPPDPKKVSDFARDIFLAGCGFRPPGFNTAQPIFI